MRSIFLQHLHLFMKWIYRDWLTRVLVFWISPSAVFSKHVMDHAAIWAYADPNVKPSVPLNADAIMLDKQRHHHRHR